MRTSSATVLSVLLAACGATPAPTAPTDPAQLGISNFAAPAPGLYTSGQPTAAQLEQLAVLGVRHVINLKPASEKGTGWEEAEAKALGITFVRLPIAGQPDVTFANATRLAEAMRASNGAPLLVCCQSSNRVGALLALDAFQNGGRSADQALDFGRAAGLSKLEPVVKQLLAAAPPAPPAAAVAAPVAKPKSLKKAMQAIEDDWHHIEGLLADPAKDLPGLAAAATRVAAAMKLGYGTFEDTEVPDFAKLAREAEAALLELAQKATAGDGDAIKAMRPTLQPQHCARCHDAVEEVHG